MQPILFSHQGLERALAIAEFFVRGWKALRTAFAIEQAQPARQV
jgi:hypothetical protein